MRKIEYTGQFRRDYKREAKKRHQSVLDESLMPILDALSCDETLAKNHKDHAVIGDWKDHRDCHVKPDLVLIYRKTDDDILQLVRIGSHSELCL